MARKRGRPRLKAENKRSASVHYMMTPGERGTLEAAAARRRMRPVELARELAALGAAAIEGNREAWALLLRIVG